MLLHVCIPAPHQAALGVQLEHISVYEVGWGTSARVLGEAKPQKDVVRRA